MANPTAIGDGAGPPPADRLLIPVGMKASAVRASRIDAPVRRLSGATMGTGWSLSFAAQESVTNTDAVAALEDVFARVIRQMSGWEPRVRSLPLQSRSPGMA